MNLLFISQYFPYPPYRDGFRIKTYNLIKHLSKYNKIFLITFCSSEEEKYLKKMAPFCVDIITVPVIDVNSNGWVKFKRLIHDMVSPLRFNSPQMVSEIGRVIQTWNPDVVHVEVAAMSQYWREIKKFPKIISSVDALSLQTYKIMKNTTGLINKLKMYLLYKQRKWIESHFFHHYDACVVVSEEDKTFLRRHCPNLRIEVIPNGVDTVYFDNKQISPVDTTGRSKIGFFGTMNFPPNVDAVLYFMTEIFPLVKSNSIDIEFYIVGRNPVKEIKSFENRKDVVVTGEVEDIRTYYNKVSLVVAPMRIGSGIKNTLLQAMSMSKPIVATPQAVRALTVEDGVHLLIANEPKDFANKVIYLLKNRSLGEELGRNARNLVVNRYSWEAHAKAYYKLYEEILVSKRKIMD